MNAAVALGVVLVRRRMGEIVVEAVPVANLASTARHEVRVLGTVKALDGTPLGSDFVARS